ncbi:MAG: hypothetical protein F6Q13_17470 [Mycobacterium sp.]|nr:hypothetical protein [Mycobacterium sp.]KAA8954684.1 MAG: hypothetical protein F6Q13_17470 [Mycobacterium sp.]
MISSRCGDCGAAMFPYSRAVRNCSGADMSDLLLAHRGMLVAWTTQDFPRGLPMPVTTDEEGNAIVTFAFQPV